jgi:hypothetical protein
MSQPPPIPTPASAGPVVKTSGAAKMLGALLVAPLFLLAVATLWIPACNVWLSSFQSHNDGSGDGNWTRALVFTLAVAVVRVIAGIVPILFGVSLAFAGSVARNLARSVFLFFALFLGPLSYGLSSVVLMYQLVPGGLQQPLNAQAFLLFGEALLTAVMVTGVALWLFPGIRAATEPEKRGANLGRLILAAVLLLGVFASGLQAFTLSLSEFGGPASSTATLALLDYEGLMMAAPVNAGSWLPLGIVTFLGLVSGILVVSCNLRFSLSNIAARPEPAGCAVGAICGLILFSTALIAVIPIFASIFGLVGFAKGSALTGLTPSLLAQLMPGIQHQLLLVLPWLVLVVPATYLAALGIGGLRQLGRHSEWILLPFFPFFFVSIGTLWPVFYQLILKYSLFRNPLAVVYPLLANVPFLVLLTLFFKGQREHWMNITPRPSFFRGVILPSLPVTVTLALAGSVFVIRDLLWQLVSGSSNDNLVQILLTNVEELSTNGMSSLVLIFAAGSILAFFPVLAVLQLLVIDRIRIRAG